MADQAELINPRYVQGYGSESLVGQICGIYEASQSGPFKRRIQWVCMLKYHTKMSYL